MSRPIVYSETLIDGAWRADEASTFDLEDEARPTNSRFMHQLRVPEQFALWELLCMGALTTQTPKSYSFARRGVPRNMSPQVAAIYGRKDRLFVAASWLTVAELEYKGADLLITPEPSALEVRPHLLNLIRNLSVYPGEPKHRRIVFWFAS